MFFSARRIPGTLSLAATNILASLVVIDQDRYAASPILVGPREFLPWWAWFALWMGSGLGLVAAVLKRSIAILHAAAGVSMGAWAANVATMAVAFALGNVDPLIMSPLAWALYLWVVVGQASMILAPLWRPDVAPPDMLDRRHQNAPYEGADRRRVA